MKYADLRCEFCDGYGEREQNIDGMDCPVICTFCNGTGVDKNQLDKLVDEESREFFNKLFDL